MNTQPKPQTPVMPDAQTVTEVRHYTDRLFSFRVTRPQSLRFRSGEFVMIGLLKDDGKPLLRVHTAGSVGGSTAVIAASHVCSGNFDTVLTVTYEKQSESNATWALSPKYPYSPHIN